MAAPATTARQSPVGIYLTDGYSTKIAFAANPNLSIWEVTVKPPGLDGGDAINITTMHNVRWRTMASKALLTLTESTMTFAIDPAAYTQAKSLINVEGSITAIFPDGSTLDFFGFLRTFEPAEHTEGEMPVYSGSISPTNFDPVNRVEADPVLTSVAGT